MSTDLQQYSPENQGSAIVRYAENHGLEIVRTYSDHGRSGLNISGRDGLRQLIADVESGNIDFNSVLVYDISRWGRFQDADESAYYEYILKRANIAVRYCAEQFENDGSLTSDLLKAVKRTMAGEYSRELSVKVFAGQCRLIEMGFRQGGPAGYGLRRQLIDRNAEPKGELGRGDRKSLQTDRVILVPGPDHEISLIREIYERFTQSGETEAQIATSLNARGIMSDFNRAWTGATVHQILTNSKYIGANVYNRRSFKLKQKRICNPPEMWITRADAFAPIVPNQLFGQANAIIHARHRHLSDDDLLERLRLLLTSKGSLSGLLIDESEDMPSSSVYARRFGGLHRAYQLIGWQPERDFGFVEINRALRSMHSSLIESILQEIRSLGTAIQVHPDSGLLEINKTFTASLVLARCYEMSDTSFRWQIRFDTSLLPDITIAARLSPGNKDVLDYFLFPKIDVLWEKLRLRSENGVALDLYRFENLRFFQNLARTVDILEIA
jgi:DNA invertase Pin-like site-specific DNA recombinase